MFNHPILKLILFPWIIGCFQTSFEPLLTPFDHFLWNFLLIICGGAAKASHLKPLPADKHCNLQDTVSFSTSDQQSILRMTLQGRGKANFTLRVWNDRWRNIFSSISRGSRLLMFFSSSPISVLNAVAFDQFSNSWSQIIWLFFFPVIKS